MTYDNSTPGSRPLPPVTVAPARDNGPNVWVIAGIIAAVFLGIVVWSMLGNNSTTASNPAINSAPGTTTGLAPSTAAPATPAK